MEKVLEKNPNIDLKYIRMPKIKDEDFEDLINAKNMNWYKIAQEISTKVMEEMVSLGIGTRNVNNVNWNNISYSQTLSEDFIREFQDKVDWFYISYYQNLSEDFIREFQDKVNWDYISYYQILSEDFIREFQDKVNWDYISYKQNLSEDFIREFQDKVNWNNISYSQNLSEDFIREFQDKLDMEGVVKKNPNIDSEYIKMPKIKDEDFEDLINAKNKNWYKLAREGGIINTSIATKSRYQIFVDPLANLERINNMDEFESFIK